MKLFKKFILIVVITVLFLYGSYLLKCRMGIDIDKHKHTSDYLHIAAYQHKQATAYADEPCALENPVLSYRIDLEKKEILITDKRAKREWQDTRSLAGFTVESIDTIDTKALKLRLVAPESRESFIAVVRIDEALPEVVYEITQDADKPLVSLEFPQMPDRTDDLQLVIPIAEGMLIPAGFPAKDFPSARRYGGGWPMAFIGMTDGNLGWMEIVETPDDFELTKSADTKGRLTVKNRWLGQKGEFGYPRRIRFCFFENGGYNAMAKRYREYARDSGLLALLKDKAEKRKSGLEKLFGAVDVWYWGKDKAEFARELRDAGIKKALFSSSDTWSVKTVNDIGFLSSVYDIYQDVWPPVYHDITRRHDGWPEDLVLDQKGDWIKGWTIKKGLKEYPGGVICSIPGLARAKTQIPKDQKDNPRTARFIDTTTSTRWKECWDKKHPTTRAQDIEYKMKLLGFVSDEMGLITGSEDGADLAAPFVDYFEGMMSPGLGRLPDSGRNVAAVAYMKPTEEFLKYQVGVDYRIPLWELVYHDSVVTTWYWGDSSNRIPELWWKKDLLNILYGNMPLWAIRNHDHWKELKPRFIASYQNVSPVFEKTAAAEMLSHRFVTDDHNVQETNFANGIRVFVNFSESEPFTIKEFDYALAAKGFVVFENGKIWKEGTAD